MRPELLIVLAGLIADRERKGAKWCEKNGVGRLRRIVGAAVPNVVTIAAASVPPEVLEAQRASAVILADHCQRCGQCKLGRVMPPTRSPGGGSRDEAS